MISKFREGFLGWKLYAIKAEIMLTIKHSKHQCLVCSIWQMFFNWSLAVSIKTLFLRIYFITQQHQRVLHVLFDFSNQMYPIHKELFKQVLWNISSVAEYFSEDIFVKYPAFQRRPVIDMSLSEYKIQYFAFIVDDMQFESIEPTDSAFPLVAIALNVLCEPSFLIWQTLSGVESIKETPVHLPRQHSWRNKVMGNNAFCCSSTKRLQDTVVFFQDMPRLDSVKFFAELVY